MEENNNVIDFNSNTRKVDNENGSSYYEVIKDNDMDTSTDNTNKSPITEITDDDITVIGEPRTSKNSNDPFDNKANFDSLFGPDYMPLFNSYKELIEAIDHNANHANALCKTLKKKCKVLTIVSGAALLLSAIAILRK